MQLKIYFLCLWFCSPPIVLGQKISHPVSRSTPSSHFPECMLFLTVCHPFPEMKYLRFFFLIEFLWSFSLPTCQYSPPHFSSLSVESNAMLWFLDNTSHWFIILATFFLHASTASLSSCISVLHLSLFTAYYYIEACISYLN